MKRVLHKPDVSGMLAAWEIKLRWIAIKGQTLADFMVDCSFSETNPLDHPSVVVGSVTDA